MRALLFAIAVAALSAAPAVAADAPSVPVSKAGQPSSQPGPVLVAADDALTSPTAQNSQPAEQQQPSADKPARHARVTTCRCGDQIPSN